MKVLKHVMAVCLLLIVLVLVSCSDEHTHTYGEWDETRAPTCLELGRRVRACTECGEEETDFLPLAPHKPGEYIPAVESLRCDEPGTVAHYICEICGKKTDASGVEITDTTYYMSHSYLPWEIGANNTKTCVGASFISECEVCGHVRQRFGTEEDHNLEHSVIPATCTESAVNVTDCLNCQYHIEEPVGTPIGHSEVTYYGISNSYHHDICSVCDNAVGERIEHTDRGDGSCSVCAGVIGPSEGIQYVLTSFSGSDEKQYMLLKYEGTLKNVIVPSEHEGIPVVAIGDRAFIGNKEMESLILPDTVSQIRYEAFSGCSSLKTVRLPKSVSRIYGEAFKDCTSLSELDLGDSLTLIDDSAFSGCTALERVTMPSTLSKIGEKAFYGCSSISEIELGEKIEYISENTFNGCTSLSRVIIPLSVTEIREDAFLNCDSIGVVVFRGTWSEFYDIRIRNGNEIIRNSPKTFTHASVRFEDTDGTALRVSKYEVGATVTNAPIAESGPLAIGGWLLDGENVELDSLTVTEDMTLVAVRVPGYAVTFVTDCEVVVPSQFIAVGGYVSRPDTPQRGPQYSFDGWYIENTDIEWDFTGDDRMTVTSDLTLVARWSILTPPNVFH